MLLENGMHQTKDGVVISIAEMEGIIMKHLSWSQLSTFNSCKKRYEFQYIKNLKPKRFSNALNFGILFHEIMECIYEEGSICAAQDIVYDLVEDMDTSTFEQKDFDDLEWSKTVLLALIDGVFDYWYNVDLERDESVVAIEKKYEMRIKNPANNYTNRAYSYVFIPDLVLQCDDSVYTLVEYKTTSRMDSNYISRLAIDQQTRGMVYFLQRENNIVISKIKYRIFKKPGIRQTKKENREMFTERLKGVFLTEPEKYFIEQEFVVDQKDIRLFATDLWKAVKEVTFVVKNKLFYRDTSKCTVLNCPFMPLCAGKVGAEVLYEEK